MKKLYLFFLLIFLSTPIGQAALTPGNVPVTKTGGATPVLQDGSISDTGTSSGAGNVGIGSTSPGQKLDVQGTIRGFSVQMTGTGDSYINATGGNVGIGKNNPAQALDVLGTIRTTNFTLTGNGAVTGYTLTTSDSAGDATWSNNGSVNAGTAGQFPYYASSASALTGTSTLVNVGGNIGVNQAAPGAQLDVQGTIRGTSFLQTGSLFNNFTGNVGVGSTAPGNALDVQGTIRSTGLQLSTAIPTVTVCGIGGTCTLGANSTDYGGNIGIGTIAASDVTIAFGHTWSNVPSCWCNNAVIHSSSVCNSMTTTTTSTIFTKSAAGAASTTLNYGCSPTK